MNLGQLSRLLRAEFLVDAKSVTKVRGVPFTAGELEQAILDTLGGLTRELDPSAIRSRSPRGRTGRATRRSGGAPAAATTRSCRPCSCSMPDLGVRREDTVFVSGIGCAARFPYYMNTYGLHSIHGRAPAIATGLAMARPDLKVWVVSGDGDALSIGGNHLIHALRRNINLTILMFNNQIYGLTKGQYSPTSELGKVTKSTPFGSLDHPFNPLSVAIGAEASFVARTHDMDRGPHDRDVPAGPRAQGRGVRRGLPELQRLQRRRLRGRHRQDRSATRCSSRCATASRSGSAPRASTAWCSTRSTAPASWTWPRWARTRSSCTTRPASIPSVAFMLSRLARGPYEPTPDRRVPRRASASSTAPRSTRQLAAAVESQRRRRPRGPPALRRHLGGRSSA